MSDFFKKFLLEDPRRLNPSGRYVALAAFGKHPGWDDHVEDLGLETESLNLAKTVLYINGIGGQIDAGAWEKLDSAQQLPSFKHVFVWIRAGQILLGRLWSSSDGKGRKRYPMVVCFQFSGVTLAWALKVGLPALAELEEECLRSTTAAEVRELLNRKRAALREAVQGADARGDFAPVSPDALNRILQSTDGSKSDGFVRVLYQSQGQFSAFAAGTFNARSQPSAFRPQQIRVPRAGKDAEEALLFWSRFFLTQIGATVPLLMALPLEENWIDVTAGEPESHEFFCLRASPRAVPLVSEVPYNFDENFRTKATAFLEKFQRGDTSPAVDLQPAAAPALAAPPPAKSGLLKWLGFGVVALLGAGTAMLLLPKGGKPAQSSTTTPTSTAIASTLTPTGSPALSHPEVAKPTVNQKTPQETEADALRLAEQKKQNEAMAAAARLNAETEAAAQEHQRQVEEAARLEKQKELARQKEAQQKIEADAAAAVAAAKAKADEMAAAKLKTIATSVPSGSTTSPVSTTASSTSSPRGEMTNSIGMILVPVPSDSGPGYWVGKYEVTQAEFQRVMGSNPSKSTINPRQPVERVSWDDAVEFTRRLTNLEHDALPAGKSYSLPTEKQWKEFVAGQKFEELPASGVTGRAEPAIVGESGPANKLGLFDVLGNVWEWCLDGATGDQKLLKGGAFNSANYDRTLLPGQRVSNCGFRCVLAGP